MPVDLSHLGSDLFITSAYFLLPVIVLALSRKRGRFPFAFTLAAFGLCMGASGITHILDIWAIRHPGYWSSGALQTVVAVVALAAAATFARVVRVLSMLRVPAQPAAALLEKNRLMAMAEQMSHVAHWRIDLLANELIWSDEIYRIMGRPLSYRPRLDTAIDSYHPDDRSLVRDLIERAIADGIPFFYEARIARADDTYRDVICSGQADRTDSGKITGVVGVFQDITERKGAEREREQLLERVSLATEGARVGIWDWNIATDILVWDPIMHALYGLAGNHLSPTAQSWAAAIHDDDRARAQREVAQAALREEPLETEFRVVWPSGEVRHIQAKARVVSNGAGSKRMIGTNWDITEVRVLAEQLHANAERDRVTAASLREKNRLMVMAEQMARVGHWRLDVKSNELLWSDEV